MARWHNRQMDPIKKLRAAYKELQTAKKSANQAHVNYADAAVVYGATGFTILNIERAMKLIEEVGQELANAKK